MSLTLDEVEKIAHLARLELTAEEKQDYQRQLTAVLDYAAMLDELDLTGVPPTAHAIARKNVMRDDVVEPSLSIEEVLFNAQETAVNQFVVQAILEE